MDRLEKGRKYLAEKSTSAILAKQVEFAKSMLVFTEEAAKGFQRDMQAMQKRDNAVMAILQQSVDIRGQMKRFWPLLSEADQETLREFGFQAPREEK